MKSETRSILVAGGQEDLKQMENSLVEEFAEIFNAPQPVHPPSEPVFVICPNCKKLFNINDHFWWGGAIHPDEENCECPHCGANTCGENPEIPMSGWDFSQFKVADEE